MKPEPEVKAIVADWLVRRGFEVESIPRGSGKSADLLATAQGETYVLEIKQRDRAPRDEGILDPATGLRYRHRIDPTGYRNKLAGLLEDAAYQTAASAEGIGGDPFRIAWFDFEPPEDVLHREQLLATIYGTRIAVCAGSARQCHFATWAAFQAYRDRLDGVVLAGPFGIAMVLNHLSPRVPKLRGAWLTSSLLPAIYDPAQDDVAFLLVPSESAPTKEWVATQLLEKYGVELISLENLTAFSAEVEVPVEEILRDRADRSPRDA